MTNPTLAKGRKLVSYLDGKIAASIYSKGIKPSYLMITKDQQTTWDLMAMHRFIKWFHLYAWVSMGKRGPVSNWKGVPLQEFPK